jgi:hypothetical protein
MAVAIGFSVSAEVGRTLAEPVTHERATAHGRVLATVKLLDHLEAVPRRKVAWVSGFEEWAPRRSRGLRQRACSRGVRQGTPGQAARHATCGAELLPHADRAT